MPLSDLGGASSFPVTMASQGRGEVIRQSWSIKCWKPLPNDAEATVERRACNTLAQGYERM